MVEEQPPTKELVLRKLMKVASKWELIGTLLKIEEGKISSIKADRNSQSELCLMDMIGTWLSKVDPSPSWTALVDVLNFIGEEIPAKEIKDEFCP